MATSTQISHSYPYPAATVAAVLVDVEFLRARLAKVGGEHAELVSYEHDAATGDTTIVTRQGIPARHLPSFVPALVPGQIVIKRTETWRPRGDGAACVVNATVSGAPATITGSLDLATTPPPQGCVLAATLTVAVSLPIVGRKLEHVVVEQLVRLLSKEHEFTMEWLSSHR